MIDCRLLIVNHPAGIGILPGIESVELFFFGVLSIVVTRIQNVNILDSNDLLKSHFIIACIIRIEYLAFSSGICTRSLISGIVSRIAYGPNR